MKKLLLPAMLLAGLVITQGCQHDEPEVINPENADDGGINHKPAWGGTDTITISFARAFGITQQQMGAGTRAAMESTVSRIDLWLIQGGDTTIYHQQQGDEGFGTFRLSLNRKNTYTLKAIGHKGAQALQMSEGIILFPQNEKITHTFYTAHTFKPDTITGGTLHLKASRIVGQMVMQTTDSVPARVKTMRFRIHQAPCRWNTADSTGTDLKDRTVEFTSISRRADGSATFTIYILPADVKQQHHYTVTATALDAQSATVEEREFTDVPIRANYRSQYTGQLFITRSTGISFEIDDWQEYPPTNF